MANITNYKITHFAGKPQGPSFSFSSGAEVVVFAVDEVVFAVCSDDTAAFSSFTSPMEGLGSQKLFLTVSPNLSPWIVAISSSRAVAWRDPSLPAKLPAPQGEAP